MLPGILPADGALRVSETTLFGDMECFRIETPHATYLYGKRGAGFAGILDPDGHDWISHQHGGKSAGEYRGLPKCGQPAKYFHCGYGFGQYANDNWFSSTVTLQEPEHVRVHSETRAGDAAGDWDFFPTHATFTLLKIPGETFWFLYEGTPGGRLDAAEDYVIRPGGKKTSLAEPWMETVPWVVFAAKESPHRFFLVNHQRGSPVDSCVSWPYRETPGEPLHQMTVFGFGRRDWRDPKQHTPAMTGLPAKFSIGFAAGAGAEKVAASLAAGSAAALRVSDTGRFLVDEGGNAVFLLADTAWSLVNRLRREEITQYLEHRRAQGFNAVTFVLYSPGNPDLTDRAGNAYGCAPFAETGGRPDPTKPLVTPGADPASPTEYDYWDHVAFAVAETKRLGFQAIILPCWGSTVVGGYRGEPTPDIVFNAENARAYGRWLGERFRSEKHIQWMLGGDRSAVYADKPERDFRAVFRALAAGLVEGGGSGTLVSFHPQKGGSGQARSNPQSSAWFHEDTWLAFNSIQLWPEHQVAAIEHDWQLEPKKPTWVFEPRYEGYWKKPYTGADWGDWQTRQQAYQSVFAGGFGFTYGHERVFGFGKDGTDWKTFLDAPGAAQMRHLVALMATWNRAQALSRLPDQALLASPEGKAERLKSDRLTATRTAAGDLAMIYDANGRPFQVHLDQLHGPTMTAAWFNPRTGLWHAGGAEGAEIKPYAEGIAAGPGAAIREFDPPGEPGDGSDWVLVLRAADH